MRFAHAGPSRMPRYAIGLAILCEVAIVYGLYVDAGPMRPTHPGCARDFWKLVTRVDWPYPTSNAPWSGDFLIDGDSFYYSRQHLHGSVLFELSRADAMALWPEVETRLEDRAENHANDDPEASVYAEWSADIARLEIDSFLDRIQDQRIKSNDNLVTYRAVEQHLMQRRVFKANHYHVNFIFEFAWLSMLVWLIFRPLIRRTSLIRAFFQWQLVPLMFFMPVYLGYASWTFTSVGPSGGVLYPRLLSYFTGGQRSVADQIILDRIPPLLISISQDIGPLMTVSGRGLIGPMSLFLLGVVPGCVCVGLVYWRRIVDRRCDSEWTVE